MRICSLTLDLWAYFAWRGSSSSRSDPLPGGFMMLE
eukprot:IDg950t1